VYTPTLGRAPFSIASLCVCASPCSQFPNLSFDSLLASGFKIQLDGNPCHPSNDNGKSEDGAVHKEWE
jgi:hypothetical protein